MEASDLAFILRPARREPGPLRRHCRWPTRPTPSSASTSSRAIDRAGGNMSDAAKLLGLHRPNLYRKMKLLGMVINP